eukprot:jgi/Mesvir1/26481/Mv16150-RA.1
MEELGGLLPDKVSGLSSSLVDYHTHVVGVTGEAGTGCCISPAFADGSIRKRLIKEVYMSACGVANEAPEAMDAKFIARLVTLIQGVEAMVRAANPQARVDAGTSCVRHVLLAFDWHHNEAGAVCKEHSDFYVPNEYVQRLSTKEHPRHLITACSVHPYRPDALDALERYADAGVRVVKWLPNAMGMDPSSPLCDRFYEAMKRRGMVLLSHTGHEKAVEAAERQAFGNPLLLRRALDAGVTVIMAHCASLGYSHDLDNPTARRQVSNFDLFLRLMDEEKYKGLLFGDISATTFSTRMFCLTTLLQRTDLHDRLLNGSDYPLPAVAVLIRTRPLVSAGLITPTQRRLLNEIYYINPLLYDLVVKRCLRGPKGERFPSSLFRGNPLVPC